MKRRLLTLAVSLLLAAAGCSEEPEQQPGGDAALITDGDAAHTADMDGALTGDLATGDGSSKDGGGGGCPDDKTSRFWTHVGETSAVIYWTTGDIKTASVSWVEYGETASYGKKTTATTEKRWAQLHRIAGLKANTTYHYRMVLSSGGKDSKCPDKTFTTKPITNAVYFPVGSAAPPYALSKSSAVYVLTKDISAGGTAIEVTGDGVTLELDGHTVTFGTSSGSQVRGILVKGKGTAVVRNGHIKQGSAAGNYSSCVETRWRTAPIEVFGITTEVARPNGYPLRLFGSGQDVKIHHNHFYSTVTKIVSRHYPGNDLLRVESSGPNIAINDNLLTEGAHRGIAMIGTGSKIEISYNDIRHHAQFVNGYALALSASGGMEVHHNRVTSTGRGVHVSGPDIELHHNHLDTKGHMTLDDATAGSGVWTKRWIELHGIKLEGTKVKRAKIHNNYMRIIQHKPDSTWTYVPATPLNIASYDPNAMNDVYNNTFIALTEYAQTKHAGYGVFAQWAAAIYLVAMTYGKADAGKYSTYVHDNKFISNDIFVGANTNVNMSVRIEKNTFTLATTPPPTKGHAPFYKLGTALETAIKSGNNTFVGMSP
jgi:Right handed beta helix region